MGYHINSIPRGTFGEFSKVTEEYLEMQDALQQDNPIMALVEAADLVGAIEAWAASHNITLTQLLQMKNATQRAFQDGTRSPR